MTLHHHHRHHVRHPFLWLALGRFLGRLGVSSLFLALGAALLATIAATTFLGPICGLTSGSAAVFWAIVWWAGTSNG